MRKEIFILNFRTINIFNLCGYFIFSAFVISSNFYFIFQSVFSKEELALQREARKGMTADEVEFSVESNLENQIYLWSDKYRPRKPRYFNR